MSQTYSSIDIYGSMIFRPKQVRPIRFAKRKFANHELG